MQWTHGQHIVNRGDTDTGTDGGLRPEQQYSTEQCDLIIVSTFSYYQHVPNGTQMGQFGRQVNHLTFGRSRWGMF